MKQKIIDRDKILTPSMNISSVAFKQLKLIITNDFTLSGKYFRVLISGKGCDGFTYSTGFTDYKDDDFLIEVKNNNETLEIVLDPFTAFYVQNATIDYIDDHENDVSGFVVANHLQKEFAGKFWQETPEKAPPVKSF